MFKMDDFMKEIKKDNSHYERFMKSSLHDLVELLKRPMPRATPPQIATEMKKIPADKWRKYVHAREYLLKEIPGLRDLVRTSATVTAPIAGYAPGKYERAQDIDGNWHEIILQQKGNSCGPACVLMVKLAWHPGDKDKLREPEIRGIVAMYEAHKEHTGVSSLSPEAVGLHLWANVGAFREPLISALKVPPCAVPSARPYAPASDDEMLKELRLCTPKAPAIVCWQWSAGGAHWTVCVGPSKDKSKLIILDPWTGCQSVESTPTGFKTYNSGAGTLYGQWTTITRLAK